MHFISILLPLFGFWVSRRSPWAQLSYLCAVKAQNWRFGTVCIFACPSSQSSATFDACQDFDLNPCIKWVLEKYWNIYSEHLCLSVQQTIQSWRGSFVWPSNGGFGRLLHLYIDYIFGQLNAGCCFTICSQRFYMELTSSYFPLQILKGLSSKSFFQYSFLFLNKL